MKTLIVDVTVYDDQTAKVLEKVITLLNCLDWESLSEPTRDVALELHGAMVALDEKPEVGQ